MLTFLLLLALLGMIAGMGWSIPICLLALLKRYLFPEKSVGYTPKDIRFFADWAVMQTVVGWITIFAFPISLFFVEAPIVGKYALLYGFFSFASFVIVFCFLFCSDRHAT